MVRRDLRGRYLGMASILLGLAWALAALAFYLGYSHAAILPVCLALTVALPLLALVLSQVRTPPLGRVAALIDSRLDDRQRLVTSLELEDAGVLSPMSEAQLSTTARILGSLDPQVVYPVRTAVPQFALAAGLLSLALGLFFLKEVGGTFRPIQPGDLAMNAPTPGAVASPTPPSGLPGSQNKNQAADPSTDNTGGTLNPEDAARQAEQSRQAQQGLDRLKSALDEQSATQGAADSLRQGNYGDAAKQLGELGQQNDQLSDQAKKGLSDALRRAADDSSSTPDLQNSERQAADALDKGDYNGINSALKDLGSAVQTTAGNIVPQQQLAKGFPQQSPDSAQNNQGQQSNNQGQSQGQDGQSSSQQNGQNNSGNDQGQGQQGSGSNSQGQNGQSGNQANGQNGGGSDPSANQGQGQSGGAGKGQSKVSGPLDPAHQNVQGNPFELQGKGDPGQTGQGDPSGQPGISMQGSGSGSDGALPAQQGGVVTAPGESNNVPVERWGVIQRYFSHDNPNSQSSPNNSSNPGTQNSQP